jgi:hypothetical protein
MDVLTTKEVASNHGILKTWRISLHGPTKLTSSLALFFRTSLYDPLTSFLPYLALLSVLSVSDVNGHRKRPFYPYLYFYNQIDIGTHF